MPIPMTDSQETKFFKFRLENEETTYVIPQTINDGTDVVQISSSWSKQNLPGSTEPMVAFNYVDSPNVNINLRFHEDMWRDANLDPANYRVVINKFASLIYPGEKGSIIQPPYCMIYTGDYVYRGYFTSIRINQSGIIRNGYKTTCEISSSFTIIRKYSPTQLGVGSSFRTYFGNTDK